MVARASARDMPLSALQLPRELRRVLSSHQPGLRIGPRGFPSPVSSLRVLSFCLWVVNAEQSLEATAGAVSVGLVSLFIRFWVIAAAPQLGVRLIARPFSRCHTSQASQQPSFGPFPPQEQESLTAEITSLSA